MGIESLGAIACPEAMVEAVGERNTIAITVHTINCLALA
jgi:hypothetical protein